MLRVRGCERGSRTRGRFVRFNISGFGWGALVGLPGRQSVRPGGRSMYVRVRETEGLCHGHRVKPV
jgi:hypothetical protein